MLIQQIVRARRCLLARCTLGFGSAEPRAIGRGLDFRLFALDALLEAFQVDDLSHGRSDHLTTEQDESLQETELQRLTHAEPIDVTSSMLTLWYHRKHCVVRELKIWCSPTQQKIVFECIL